MPWYPGTGITSLAGLPNDSGTISLRPDGVTYTEDGVFRGTVDGRLGATYDGYDRIDFQLEPGFRYTFENYFSSTTSLWEFITITETGSGRSLLTYLYLQNELLRDATSTAYPITVSAPTLVSMIVGPVGQGSVANQHGSYEVDIYADPVVISTFNVVATVADRAEGSDPSQGFGQTATTPYTFTINRQGFTADYAIVNWSVASTTANDDDFFGGKPSSYVSFSPGDVTKTITVDVKHDSLVEADEQFTFTLTSVPVGNVIGTASATGVIRNDDAAAVFSIVPIDASRPEGPAGSITPFTFSVVRSGNLTLAASVNVTVTSEQLDGSDFSTGTLPSPIRTTFVAGQTNQTITLRVRGDSTYEPHETFTVRIAAATGFEQSITISSATALGLVQNDDLATRSVPAGPGKSPSFLFDPVFYLWASPELIPTVSLAGAYQNYLSAGAVAGKQPTSWFDATYYGNRWPDLAPLHLDDATLFSHYNLYGVWEGRSAGPKFDNFDGNRYLAENPDVAAYVDAYVADFLGSRTNGAIAHFVIYGANEQRIAHDTGGQTIDMGYIV